jgi:TPR repeat protein
MLSRCCYYGVGTAVDYPRALELARESAACGSARGQCVCSCDVHPRLPLRAALCRYMLGVIHAGGKSGPKDEVAAAECWSAAAQQGDVWSKYRLASLTHLARPEIDLTVASAPAGDQALTPRHAAATSLLHAQASRAATGCRNHHIVTRQTQDLFMSASAHASAGNWASAVEMWEQAAAIDHVPSRAALAEVYSEGRPGVARWLDRAAALSQKGSDQGCGACKVGVAWLKRAP